MNKIKKGLQPLKLQPFCVGFIFNDSMYIKKPRTGVVRGVMFSASKGGREFYRVNSDGSRRWAIRRRGCGILWGRLPE